jgi:hypothetical protein
VDVLLGNVLALPADLLVLPATSLGTLGDPWHTFLLGLGVQMPIAGTTLGSVVMLEVPKTSYVRHVAVAATVARRGAPADAEIVGRLAEQLGTMTRTHGIVDVLTPVLGAVSGNLSPEM